MQRFKKRTRFIAAAILLIAVVLFLQYAYAGGGSNRISLNSPVSFPVDI